MIPDKFDYIRADSIKDAISLLAQHGDDAKLLAGGHSLVPAMKLRLSSPSTLIDLSGIGELNEIKQNGDRIEIGAFVTHRTVENSEIVKKNCGALAEAAGKIGDPQVRNRGTIGGSLAHADPAADYPALVLALNADVYAEGNSGTRSIAADDFFTGLFETALNDDEIITKVSFPVIGKGIGADYEKFPHPASRFAVVGVAAMVSLDSGKCTAARVGVTGAAPTAFRATDMENALIGKPLDQQTISDAAANVPDPLDLLSDLVASAEYRAHLCSVLAKRALTAAASRAK